MENTWVLWRNAAAHSRPRRPATALPPPLPAGRLCRCWARGRQLTGTQLC